MVIYYILSIDASEHFIEQCGLTRNSGGPWTKYERVPLSFLSPPILFKEASAQGQI